MRNLYLHQRFFLILLAGVFALLLAYIYPVLYSWVIWLLCMAGIVIVADIVLLYGFGHRLDARRDTASKWSNGEDNPVKVHLCNDYPFAVRVRVADEIPVEFQRRDLGMTYRLKARQETEYIYHLRPVKRGGYEFGQVRVFVTSRLSLVERRYSFAAGHKVVVYPSFMAMKKYELLAFAGRQSGNGSKRMRVAGITMSFDQIKPYVQGDDPRTVNWKATAKCNRLMVNSYTEERSQQVYCLVDKGRTMQAPFNGMTILDYAINATLVLSNIILKKGDRAGLFTFSNKPGTLVKADNRGVQLNHICEALYKQRTHHLESDFDQLCLVAARRINTRSLLFLFTNFDTLNGMRRRLLALKRLADNHLLLLVMFEDTEINRLAGEPAGSIRDVYFKTIAGGFALEKKQIVRELQNAGIYVLLTQPEHLTVNAINSYLEFKERGLI